MTIKWNYIPKDDEITKLTDFIQKYYGKYYRDYFIKIISFQKRVKELNLKCKKEEMILNNIQKGIKEIQQKIDHKNTRINFLQTFFSVKNENSHKVLTILGIRIKLKKRGA